MYRGVGSAIVMALLLLLPGCTGLLNDDVETVPEEVTCEDDPSQPDCFEEVITEDDCTSIEVFTGEYCRLMLRPEMLDFGETSITLVVGSKMQALTPSFYGDAPGGWLVNPGLPDGISLDSESGVISGTPTAESQGMTHTIIATNAVGSASDTLQITVLPIAPQSISYPVEAIHCTMERECTLQAPEITGGTPVEWVIEPPFPEGLALGESGSITGAPMSIGDSNHTITASNAGGSAFDTLRIITLHQPPQAIDYGSQSFILTYGEQTSITPSTSGGEATSWSIDPDPPIGMEFTEDGSIVGSPLVLQDPQSYSITATNTGGSVTTTINIEVWDIPVWGLSYSPSVFDLTQGDSIGAIAPQWSGGTPASWEVEPPLPSGFHFDASNGTVSGTALNLQEWGSHTIWANNTGGSDSMQIRFRVISKPPTDITWPSFEFTLEANESVLIPVTNVGPAIDTWEVSPPLPSGLALLSNGTIEGTPDERTDWAQYTIWANNTGGSDGQSLWIAVHDLAADQSDLLRGMGNTNWGGWPSPILPIGEWAFPVGFTQEGYGSTIPVISASHVGRGKMLGYGHESWVDGAGPKETAFSLQAVEWVCGENADVGLAYGAGYDGFEDELEDEGHAVHLSVTPDNLSGIDCLLDEFWNGHDDADNQNLVDFMLAGGGLIMGGHAWYWSYSNSDVSHNYPGNKIAKTTGLFVSHAWGYNNVDFRVTPHELTRPQAAIEAIRADRIYNQTLSADDAAIADATLSICTGVVALDFHGFWSPLREVVNQTGWTIIEYGTLWEDVGYDLGEDPIADTLLRVEAALTQGLPANELPAHPSHAEFPGEVPANATRITRDVTIDGNQSGLPGNFGYSSARAHLRMTTGLYAAPGEVVTVTLPSTIVDTGTYVLVGAHSDSLWDKSQLHRHPQIVRWWYADSVTMEVGNAFGGPIYIAIQAGSTLGDFDVTISNVIKAPRYIHGQTDVYQWQQQYRNDPAPWAEIGSGQFILTVPSHEIRDLDNPEELMDWWDEALGMEHAIYGYLPWPRVERAVFDAQISAGWMHSGYPFMAHDLSVAGVVNVSYMGENGDWGMFHELGHNHQWMPSTLPGTTETGCNFASVYLMEELVDPPSLRPANPSRSYFEDGSNISNWSVWTALDTFLVVKEEWGWGPITEALIVYYTLPAAEVPSTGDEKFNAWVIHLSNATGYNLAPYHAAWGFPLNQETYDALDHLPVWVDDPLRGDFFVYDAVLRNLQASNVTANSTVVSWETYDNGTNTTLTLHYGTSDGGTQSSSWANSVDLGPSEVGNGSQELTGLDCCGTTYYARIEATHEEGDTWFGPISWVTDYLPD